MPIHPKKSCEARAEIGLKTPPGRRLAFLPPPCATFPPSRQLVEAKLPANPFNIIIRCLGVGLAVFSVVWFGGHLLLAALA